MKEKVSKIKYKLRVSFLIFSIISLSAIGIISLVYSGKALTARHFYSLKASVEKKNQDGYFFRTGKDLRFLVETVSILEQAAFEKLNTVQENKKAQLTEYLKKVLSDISVISKDSTVIRSLADFNWSWGK
jgi:methyl-accepting chemotaxis protein